MPVALIVYGKASRIVRRIITADSIPHLSRAAALADGEDIIICNPEDATAAGPDGRTLPDLDAARAMVLAKEGGEVESDRCLMIDDATGDIESVTLADPLIDKPAGRTLYQHPEAQPGWAVDEDGEFVPPAAEPA